MGRSNFEAKSGVSLSCLGEVSLWLLQRPHGVFLERHAPVSEIIFVSDEMAIGSVTGAIEIEFGGVLEWQI